MVLLKNSVILIVLAICICGCNKNAVVATGLVVDQDNKPVAGAKVVLKYGEPIMMPLPFPDVSGKHGGLATIALTGPIYQKVAGVTDDNGSFRIEGGYGMRIVGVDKDNYAWDRSFEGSYLNNYGAMVKVANGQILFMLYDIQGYDINNVKHISLDKLELYEDFGVFYVDLVNGCKTLMYMA